MLRNITSCSASQSLLLAFILISLTLAGCTRALWKPKFKEEAVNGFYVHIQSGDLIVTTLDNAYIFPKQARLGKALQLTRQAKFFPIFDDFTLTKDNQISGTVTLAFLEQTPSPALLKQVYDLGFANEPSINRIQLTQKIEGRRYQIEGDLPLQKLDETYNVTVIQPSSPLATAGKIIATPATIAYDAVVTVPAMLVVATAMSMDDS